MTMIFFHMLSSVNDANIIGGRNVIPFDVLDQ